MGLPEKLAAMTGFFLAGKKDLFYIAEKTGLTVKTVEIYARALLTSSPRAAYVAAYAKDARGRKVRRVVKLGLNKEDVPRPPPEPPQEKYARYAKKRKRNGTRQVDVDRIKQERASHLPLDPFGRAHEFKRSAKRESALPDHQVLVRRAGSNGAGCVSAVPDEQQREPSGLPEGGCTPGFGGDSAPT